MTTDRIKEIQECTAYPIWKSVQIALLQVWNECAQQSQSEIDSLTKEVDATFHELEGYKEHVKQLLEEVERLRNLNTRLFALWDSLAEIGEIHIGVGFSSTYDKLKEDINQQTK